MDRGGEGCFRRCYPGVVSTVGVPSSLSEIAGKIDGSADREGCLVQDCFRIDGNQATSFLRVSWCCPVDIG